MTRSKSAKFQIAVFCHGLSFPSTELNVAEIQARLQVPINYHIFNLLVLMAVEIVLIERKIRHVHEHALIAHRPKPQKLRFSLTITPCILLCY